MTKNKPHSELSNCVRIYFDGGAEPNPGPAAGAAVLDLPSGETVTVAVSLGITTNNVAEYSGCIAGLKKALELGYKAARVFGDCYIKLIQHDTSLHNVEVYFLLQPEPSAALRPQIKTT